MTIYEMPLQPIKTPRLFTICGCDLDPADIIARLPVRLGVDCKSITLHAESPTVWNVTVEPLDDPCNCVAFDCENVKVEDVF
jgi:hypothetical protein